MSAARSETMSLYRQFVRLRHQYPNKQGRSKLRRWTDLYFSLKELQYHRLAQQKGRPAAQKEAEKWRTQAQKDFGTSDGCLSVVPH